ncbi:hypothetical protein D3C72_1952470 [compost metagenome]
MKSDAQYVVNEVINVRMVPVEYALNFLESQPEYVIVVKVSLQHHEFSQPRSF